MSQPHYRTVLLDCDSTLTDVEGIAELAGDRRAEISQLTDLAMRGLVPLEEVFAKRLELIQPTAGQVIDLGGLYTRRCVPGAREVVQELRANGVEVRIVSGGLFPAIALFAHFLGLEASKVAAVGITFDFAGRYSGFESDNPLALSGGKRIWIERHDAELPRPRLFVGDGATDLETRPAVDTFAAFTGVVDRSEISAQADVVIPGPGLDQILRLVLGAG